MYFEFIMQDFRDVSKLFNDIKEVMDKYGVITLEEIKVLVDIHSEYLDSKYAYVNLNGTTITKVKDGWEIKLPYSLPVY